MNDNTNATVRHRGSELIWEEWIRTDFGTDYHVRIEAYDFPFVMPKVWLLKPKIHWRPRKHVWTDGSLCVMDPQDFNSRATVLQVRNQTAAWCFCTDAFRETGVWYGAEH